MKRNPAWTATLAAIGFALFAALTSTAQAAPCTLAGIGGSYAYSFAGSISPAANQFVPAAAAGRLTVDAHGNVTGSQTISVAGSAEDETLTGTYTVAPDCTGTFTLLVQPGARAVSGIVVWTNNANDDYFVFNTPGFTMAGSSKKISPRD
jgi:hypothetical protein